jgi:biotin operon repressor
MPTGMTAYAQIPTNLICRFGELTKTEIVVISYLYAARNRKSGQCNPSRSAIARAVKIGRSHVSPAVKGLQDKGWIIEDEHDNFLLLSEPRNVPESGQVDVTESGQGTESGHVLNPQQECPESVTGVSRIGNTVNKDSFEQKKEQRKEQKKKKDAIASRPEYHTLLSHHETRLGTVFDYGAQGKAINTLLEHFPASDCVAYYDYQVKQLKPQGWRDSVSWLTVQKTIAEWIAGGKPLEPLEKNGSYKNGNRKRTDADVIAESIKFYENFES